MVLWCARTSVAENGAWPEYILRLLSAFRSSSTSQSARGRKHDNLAKTCGDGRTTISRGIMLVKTQVKCRENRVLGLELFSLAPCCDSFGTRFTFTMGN